jgi:1,4-dihydroxy-6-naphthoate synthase
MLRDGVKLLKNIKLAHSPDADDIFMYYAIKFGWVSSNYNFLNKADDIETLNQETMDNLWDVSAISFGLYPHIFKDYALLKTAVSFGEGYGPKLIKLKGKNLKKNFKVALSGKYTTNALIFRLKYPEAKVKYYNFLEIEKAVLDGEVDAGVLIHESILTYDNRLEVEAEIWDIWCELNKENLPLPLGGMAIRRSLPLLDAINIEEILTKAVKVANSHKKLLSKMLIERNLVRVDSDTLDKYLSLYANDDSISMNETQLKAINKLFEIGYNGGFYDKKLDVNECLIPREYKELRFN